MQTNVSLSANDLIPFTSANLNSLLEKYSISGKELAHIIGCTESTVSAIRNQKQFPTMDFLLSLKSHFNISIDDFISTNINRHSFSSACVTDQQKEKELGDYKKYEGTYYIYYLNTECVKGNDHNNAAQSLLFGILHIYENPDALSKPDYKCMAVLNIQDIIKAKQLKEHIQNSYDLSEITSYLYTNNNEDYRNSKIYTGEFYLTRYHSFLSMTDSDKNRVLASFHRMPNSKSYYYGGLGTVNSISEGSEPMPVVQMTGLSREILSLSSEEIYHKLLLKIPDISAGNETDELIQVFKKYYIPSSEFYAQIDDSVKKSVITGRLEQYIKKSVEQNVFRYGKISSTDDDEWYHMIKNNSDISNKFL